MIYRLLRKEMGMRTPQLMSAPDRSESLFIEEISRFVKLVKRKEELYLRLMEAGEGGEAEEREFEGYLAEGVAIERMLEGFRGEHFFASKTYYYTAFMRVREVLEAEARRFRAQGRRQLERYFDQSKSALTELYNNSAYQQRYELQEIIAFANKNQNGRIAALLPKRRLPALSPGKSRKILERLGEAEGSRSFLRKTISVQVGKGKEQRLQEMINKKLIVHELATEKRIKQRRRGKRVTNLWKLYDVLEVRGLPAERSGSFKEELEAGMTERNQRIREERKGWEKKYLLFRYCRKERRG